jgi:GNAT superfamily N-acetyltransferase
MLSEKEPTGSDPVDMSSGRVATITMLPSAASSVAALHAASIASGFLSTLPQPFLRRLYRAIAADSQSTVLAACAQPGAAPIGFVAGTLDTSAMYRRIIRTEWFWFALALAPRMCSLSTVTRALETLRYGNRQRSQPASHSCAAELLSIAVSQDQRGKGLGRTLIMALEEWIRAQDANVSACKTVTLASDTAANAFYLSCGFEPRAEFRHHDNLLREYVKQLATG